MAISQITLSSRRINHIIQNIATNKLEPHYFAILVNNLVFRKKNAVLPDIFHQHLKHGSSMGRCCWKNAFAKLKCVKFWFSADGSNNIGTYVASYTPKHTDSSWPGLEEGVQVTLNIPRRHSHMVSSRRSMEEMHHWNSPRAGCGAERAGEQSWGRQVIWGDLAEQSCVVGM